MRSILVAIALVGAGMLASVTWYVSRRIARDAFSVRDGDNPLDIEVIDVTDGRALLKPLSADGARELRRPGTYGFQFDGGYAHAGPILELPDDPWAPVTRAFSPVRGTATSGARGRIDSFTFDGDPSAVGLGWEPVVVAGPGGQYPAWLVAGDASRWTIFVHGKGARHAEALRLLPVVSGEGWTGLVIGYRNDAGCRGDGCYRYGADEWEDLESAVRFAIERGAKDVVLVGYSMGGGISLSFMNRSSLATVVEGLILDSPVSDLRALLTMRMAGRKVPAVVTRMGIAVAARRAGIRTADAGHHGQTVEVPVLLLHGEEDDVVPIALSERFVEGRENVRFVRFAGAGHVRGWNVDREGYEGAVRDFLREI